MQTTHPIRIPDVTMAVLRRVKRRTKQPLVYLIQQAVEKAYGNGQAVEKKGQP